MNATGAQDSQETGSKGDMLMDEREMDNMLPGDTIAGHNATKGIRRKSYTEAVIDRVRRRARVFVGGPIALCKGTTLWFAFEGQKYRLSHRGWDSS